ncbi:alpha/beta hydrolase [Mesorhizobium sp. M1C.F.Ca.ET.193.01.1.1]|uniref:alpha/beta hydrolase n=1 Tax=unclassified Mesorhizobium TaxID=325217 RepID=UPI000FD4FCF6|nr:MULTISPECIES: alpha/beta hydrolase [unclassified Mesorhizobium]TGT00305.1 alpha/beta hydrolase [bacterium M00.F.Ca.ET.177.01.1.1]TGQ53710.1 alpha/beta hydrolase [Mesorhizobium sp. M1C.F.Ca.ET.210.01.1.1]TGQ71743.1 alpha/beta hydrolase [Mesorhizobium sp. M1C.F.Ca.ET.212.01.1.1]TGR08484.1 alpha/beta hydrolase [Mesorhizobium sp. M1C.F.Ca.ET.204.01.1.1]TGR28724.1 alpha/beta hydrolase [Mesorhizobium sp. M1C.F.Ca.ET.196.01.1.1]
MSEHASKNSELQHDLPFAYRLIRPEEASGECLFVLHGSGVDETTLAPLARQIAPRAVLIAVRGRIRQEDGFRWFERITPTSFEQSSIRSETAAFAQFVAEAATRHGLDLSRSTFLGYSNGANLVSTLMLLHPGLVRQAALLRAMPVLDDAPATDLAGTRVLIIAGAADQTYGPFAPALVTLFSQRGAEVDARIVASGHEFGDTDAAIARQWLAAATAVA